MVHITYRHAELSIDGFASTLEDRHIVREYHFYISDDRSHSAEFVQYCFGHHDEFLSDRRVTMIQRWIWSDGCGAQFKSARQFLWLWRWHRSTRVPIIWSFFETGHGKGEHDGAGACVKRALRRYQLQHDSERLCDAAHVTQWCMEHIGSSATSSFPRCDDRQVSRYFWTVPSSAIASLQSFDCRTVKGTQQLHSILSSDHPDPTIYTRALSCFCGRCIDGHWGRCLDTEWVTCWIEQRLRPIHRLDDIVEEEEEQEQEQDILLDDMLFSTDYDTLTDDLAIGDIFAVIAESDNSEGVEYYLLQCTRSKYLIDEATVDGHGQHFESHSMIVGGRYFIQTPQSDDSSYLEFERYMWKKEAIHFSHLVVAIKLKLTVIFLEAPESSQHRRRYHLDIHDHESIIEVIRAREGAD